MRRTTAAALLAVALAGVAGCGGGSAARAPRQRPSPNLQAFLALPVATPSSCGGKVSGSTVGRRSPWVGTVDVSVFVEPTATPAELRDLGRRLAAAPGVSRVYFESAAQAYAEFARLYTCSADVPRASIPASYRLVLSALSFAAREQLIATIRGLPTVTSVSCDPSEPCLGQ